MIEIKPRLFYRVVKKIGRPRSLNYSQKAANSKETENEHFQYVDIFSIYQYVYENPSLELIVAYFHIIPSVLDNM